jgi:TIR domain
MAGRIFINYRRDDSAGTAGRLRDRLADAFGPKNLFMDVDNIPAGIDFVTHLRTQLATCDAFLAVIGPNWLNARDESGDRRLDNPDDLVSVEIATALARNIRVIPVTVDGARLPKANELPDRLTPLVRHAIELHNAHFRRDAETLIEKVRNSLRGERARPVRWRMTLIGAGALLAGCIGLSQMDMPVRVPWTGGVVVADEGASRFDGTWRIDRMGCPPRPELNFQIHVENGNVGGRFEPREMSAIPGIRPAIIGAISASGQINFSHTGVSNEGVVGGAVSNYSGTFHGDSASGLFGRADGTCNGTFTVTRA